MTRLTLLALATIGTLPYASAARDFEVRALSSRPDAVSGDDVLVSINMPQHSHWTAHLNGIDVTRLFRTSGRSAGLIALLNNLQSGANSLEVRISGQLERQLTLLAHPLVGPIFSGPHQEPFICQTQANGLGPALDAHCSAKTIVRYYYRSTALPPPAKRESGAGLPAGFKPYDPSGPMPTDVAKTVTSEGLTVNYIVRSEFGTLNRAIYVIQFLHQPGQPLPTPWTRPTLGWNGRLVYAFGGGCGAGYRQGMLMPGDIDAVIGAGYALATSTFNIYGNNCNDRLSAETLSIVKEHFIESYGLPVHTIGIGGSGGAQQVYLTAQNYPGLLDGILPFGSSPDAVTGEIQSFADCGLLEQAFAATEQRWTEAQKTAVSGFATWRTCMNWNSLPLPYVDPRRCNNETFFELFGANGGVLPQEIIYDPLTNSKGVRCTLYDNEVNVFGRNPRTGFAYRPLDNVGVQYGLVPFDEGKITAEQFVELNMRIGGYDEDGSRVEQRMNADSEAVRLAYARGLVLTGGGGLSEVPIIDWDTWYGDDLGDPHDHVRSFIVRARLIAANGHADNQVILTFARPDILTFLLPRRAADRAAELEERIRGLVRQMDYWLDQIAADSSSATRADKVVRNRPHNLADGCWTASGEHIVEPAAVRGAGRCSEMYPAHGDPRSAAGAPLRGDILKCSLKPLDPVEYTQHLSTDQLRRLEMIFPTGVCDYSEPGIQQQLTPGTWQRASGES